MMRSRWTDSTPTTLLAALLLLGAGCRSARLPEEPLTVEPATEPATEPAVEAPAPEVEPVADGEVRVAFVQLASSEVGDFDTLTAYAKQAKAGGAEMIVYPEASVFGWLNPAVFTEAAPIPGTYSEQFATIAEEVGIWVATGLAEQGTPAEKPGVYQAYDSSILVNPSGELVLHHRKYQVLQNAFSPEACEENFGTPDCSYEQGSLSDITVADSPLGSTAIIVCADAYTYDESVLDVLKGLQPDAVIVVWGVAAGETSECGTDGYNATTYAGQAAVVIGSANVLGANGLGDRPYGKYLPSVYCGYSGWTYANGEVGGETNASEAMVYFDLPAASAEVTPEPAPAGEAAQD